MYDPFAPGSHPVGVRTVHLRDTTRSRVFPCEIWSPAGDPAAPRPLVGYSHARGGNRRSASFLAAHLASHGYLVAALDHSDRLENLGLRALSPARNGNGGAERAEQRMARLTTVVADRLADLRFLVDHLTARRPTAPVGLVGHSLGGWTVLAGAQTDPRVTAVVAHSPAGGAPIPKPGLAPVTLDFRPGWTVPVLFLSAEFDVPVPPAEVRALCDRLPGPGRMFTLAQADHQHFVDDVEVVHEEVRELDLPPEAAWIVAQMRPMAELCPGRQAHRFVRGLTLAHLDATLGGDIRAAQFLSGDVCHALASYGVATVSA